ncbi:MAG: phosphatidate cytidylyltransferase [bacterium]
MIKRNEFVKRLVVAIIGVPVIIFFTLYGKILFLVLISFIMVVSLWEFYSFSSFINKTLYNIIGTLALLLINTDFYLYSGKNIYIIISSTVILIILVELFSGTDNAVINTAVPILGIVYMLFFTFFIVIREHLFSDIQNYSYGGYVIIYIFTILWSFDISAYLFGSMWGKHSLYPQISPKKTWEGTLLGIMTALIVSLFINHYLHINLSHMTCLIFTLILCITAQLSDLVESMFKRDSQVKDSSKILPGHGGIFDRFDGFFLVAPVSYLMIKIFF